jgi:aminopeptidase N
MLERRLGQPAFTHFLRRWFDEHAFAAASTHDFEGALVAAWGPQATRFVADWLYGLGHPECVVRLRLVEGGVEVIVDQIQTTGPVGGFSFPLDIDLVNGHSRQRVTVDVAERHTVMRASMPFIPTEVQIDPDVMLYAHTECRAAVPCR